MINRPSIRQKSAMALSIFCILAATTCQAKGENSLHNNRNQSTVSIESDNFRELTIERQIKGDLNKDGRSDLALVARRNQGKEKNTNPQSSEQSDRALILLFRNPNSESYSEIIINWKIISALGEDDSFDRIEIANGVLYIYFQDWPSSGTWWSQSARLAFRLEKNCVQLIGADRTEINRATSEKFTLSVNYLTQKTKKTSDLLFSSSKKQKIEWGNLSRHQEFCIDDFGDGASFDPLTAEEAAK